MLIELHEEGLEEFNAVLKQAIELTDWDIDSIFMDTLNLLTPLRYEKQVVAKFNEKYGGDTYERILSVNNTIQLEWSYNSRGTPISRSDVITILPYADKIADTVIRNKDEVRILFNLMQKFDYLPATIDINGFADTHRIYAINADTYGRPVRYSIKRMEIKINEPATFNIILENDRYPLYLFMTSGSGVSLDWMFKMYNLPALTEMYKKFIDWYSKTFEKQLKIRDTMLKFQKTLEMEKRLLQ